MVDNKKRPSLIGVIGWCFIILAIVTILSCVISIYNMVRIDQIVKSSPEIVNDIPNSFQLLISFLPQISAFLILQTTFAVFLLIVSIYFLKLHTWARTVLEVICWLAIISSLLFTIIWIIAWPTITTQLSSLSEFDSVIPKINIYNVIAYSLLLVIWILPLIFVIKYIRNKQTRQFFK